MTPFVCTTLTLALGFWCALVGAVIGFGLCAVFSRALPDPCERPNCDRRIP